MVSHRLRGTGRCSPAPAGHSAQRPPRHDSTRRSAQDPPLLADGGLDWNELTGFQRDLLKAIRRCGCEEQIPTGQTIKVHVERRYDGEINNGRLYQNLGALVEAELLEKGFVDGRTNTYSLSPVATAMLDETVQELADICGIALDVTDGLSPEPVAQQ